MTESLRPAPRGGVFLYAAWLFLSLAILALDIVTGPLIAFPVLFVVPVILATWSHGVRWTLPLVVALTLARSWLDVHWESDGPPSIHILNGIIRGVVLCLMAMLVDWILRQRHQIQVLQGILPTCAVCKRIRDEAGEWHQMESYISRRSEARFSHGFCPECFEKQYGEDLTRMGLR
ncbi:MAG: hypothetical protein HYX75_01710 [Acidobacteria bacterium]|nr:hypothetical protein [Acidobacteriota bacterium]